MSRCRARLRMSKRWCGSTAESSGSMRRKRRSPRSSSAISKPMSTMRETSLSARACQPRSAHCSGRPSRPPRKCCSRKSGRRLPRKRAPNLVRIQIQVSPRKLAAPRQPPPKRGRQTSPSRKRPRKSLFPRKRRRRPNPWPHPWPMASSPRRKAQCAAPNPTRPGGQTPSPASSRISSPIRHGAVEAPPQAIATACWYKSIRRFSPRLLLLPRPRRPLSTPQRRAGTAAKSKACRTWPWRRRAAWRATVPSSA